jgi:hypothetical protein
MLFYPFLSLATDTRSKKRVKNGEVESMMRLTETDPHLLMNAFHYEISYRTCEHALY